MKRYINLLIDRFANWLSQVYWWTIVGFSISGLLGIALAIMMYTCVDTIPATPSDYEELNRKMDFIQQNPDLLLETDCKININGEIITIEVENDQCKIIKKYDKNFQELSTSKEDKCKFWLQILVLTLLISYIIAYGVGKILSLILKKVGEIIVRAVKKRTI